MCNGNLVDPVAIQKEPGLRLILTLMATCFAVVILCPYWALATEDRPNIVWIVSEDNSIHYLDHFFDGGAKAPNIEQLAKDGITFNHAFSNAPVCSVARTTLATMCYAPRIGTQFHRRYQMAPMPVGLKMFPAYLRDAGYYTTNKQKKDYNAVEGTGVWDKSSRMASWRNRPKPDMPFFHMVSLAQSHEGSLHFNKATYEKEKTVADPATVKLADYFPDTPLFRYTHARYHDRMKAIDDLVGGIVGDLKKDGLLENTFVFYFGDHGGVLPRSKGYLYESGLHVPLVVRIPSQFRHLAVYERGSRANGFVEFVDFGATVLNLAGAPIPDNVDGIPFLGGGVSKDAVEKRNESFGYADRFDEKYDLVRSVRRGKFQYIRNFQPYLPDGLQNIYRYKMLAYREWESLFKQGKLSPSQEQFFRGKPAEALFDVEADPHQINNLANDPSYSTVLKELRNRLVERMGSMPDLSLFPESVLVGAAMKNPQRFGQEHRKEISEYLEIANLALLPLENVKKRLREELSDSDFMRRYWAAMVCASFGKSASELADDFLPLLKDPQDVVRIRTAEFLGQTGVVNPQPTLVDVVNTTDDPVIATEALNSIVWFRDFFQNRYPVQRSDFNPDASGADVDDRLNYINGIPYPAKKTAKQKKKKNSGRPKKRVQ